jgi:hypothetical protein
MNRHPIDSNVYYLPSPALAEAPQPRLPQRLRFSARLRSAWWRLRLAFAEVRTILFRPPRPAADAYGDFVIGDEELAERSQPRRACPAVVIDFETARLRLRPAPEA